MSAGLAAVHQPYEAHLDIFDRSTSEILNLPLIEGLPDEGVIAIDDPEAIARLAEKDSMAASRAIAASYRTVAGEKDWPDLLASDLVKRQDLCLREWAHDKALAPETLSRGFAKAYGTTPARFRSEIRARNACRALAGPRRLAAIAFDLGFADQAHMTRAVKSMAGEPPRAFCNVNSVQDRS
jgi:AraC-like DNA-binding protein